MRPLRLLVAVAALAVAGFTDAGKHFSIDFPDGWSAPTEDKEGNAQTNSPSMENVFCRANSVSMPTLKDTTQAKINATYSAPFDLATWAAVLTVDAAKMQISEGQARMVDGHVVQVVTIALNADVLGVPMKARFASHILVGRMVNAGCFAPLESFDGLRTVFENVLVSQKPQ